MVIDYERFIEENFSILHNKLQVPVPYKLNEVQKHYIKMLKEENPEMEGVRDIVLKARQEGISSFVLALFTVDFILRPHSISICISHRKDSTEILFKKVKFYIESFCNRNGYNIKDYLETDSKGLITSRVNEATFYIGTAGARVGGRGGSARNILFSEAAFYQDSEKITASEMITGTAQQVPQGQGMIFIESTANGTANYYYDEWQRAVNKKSTYKPRFFGWQMFYTKEWVEEKRKDFQTDAMWKQEYPGDPDEAFVTSGSPYFDNSILKEMLDSRMPILEGGRLAADGTWI